MNRNSICFLILLSVLIACKPNSISVNPLYKPSDEGEIISLAINENISPDTTYKQRLLHREFPEVSQGLFKTVKDRNDFITKQNRKRDTLKKELDTAKIYVLITDTLVRLHPNFLTSATLDSAGNKIPGIDATSYTWASEIIIKQDTGKFDMKNLAFKYNYQYQLKSKFKSQGGNAFYVGTYQISPVFFNKNKSKAFVYLQKLGGWSKDIFLEKRNGNWTIVENERVSRF